MIHDTDLTSFVSALSAFHAQAGQTEKAETLATALLETVDDLVTVNDEVGVLTESGEAALQSMMDYLTLIRLK